MDSLKVYCVVFGDFGEETVTSSMFFLFVVLFLPVNYGGLRTQAWIPRPPSSSSLVCLKTRAFSLTAALSTPGFLGKIVVQDGSKLAARP